ncbi:alpha/beta fold hydrolase [Acinetobacter soli]|uniref:alpha/beta fold hydrolase n=1 Tax=Acinetobacter soli TaxID=487316 RepID=UPI001C09FBCE|nr:alpha/beta hydrolase [Acinetobacter soli]
MMTLVEKLQHFPVQMLEISGATQAYRESGSGEQVLVLLHGISSGSGSWVQQLETLGHHFRVIAWDAPGYGLSDPLNTAEPKATDYAERLKALLDGLNIDTAIVVGHSLGALQASAFAQCYPDRVEQLIIANVAQGYERYSAEQQADVYHKRPKLLVELGQTGLAQTRGPHLTFLKTPVILELIEQVMQNLHLEGFTHASYLLAYDEIRNYLNGLKVPCTVIAGQCDSITPAEAIKKLAQEIQCQNYIEIQAAGHLSYVDQVESFNQIVLSVKQHINER